MRVGDGDSWCVPEGEGGGRGRGHSGRMMAVVVVRVRGWWSESAVRYSGRTNTVTDDRELLSSSPSAVHIGCYAYLPACACPPSPHTRSSPRSLVCPSSRLSAPHLTSVHRPGKQDCCQSVHVHLGVIMIILVSQYSRLSSGKCVDCFAFAGKCQSPVFATCHRYDHFLVSLFDH